jgi:hypothetical protein
VYESAGEEEKGEEVTGYEGNVLLMRGDKWTAESVRERVRGVWGGWKGSLCFLVDIVVARLVQTAHCLRSVYFIPAQKWGKVKWPEHMTKPHVTIGGRLVVWRPKRWLGSTGWEVIGPR